jgi:hypothetical protein
METMEEQIAKLQLFALMAVFRQSLNVVPQLWNVSFELDNKELILFKNVNSGQWGTMV